MSDETVCKTCGARLFSGGGGGKLACPVCGSLLPAASPVDPSAGHPEAPKSGRRSPPLMMAMGIIGLALLAFLFLHAQRRNSGVVKDGTPQKPASVDMIGSPQTVLRMFEGSPNVDTMRNYLRNADADSLRDPQDCGLYLALEQDWQYEVAVEENNYSIRPSVVLADWKQATFCYLQAAQSPQTRLDYKRLLLARQWLINAYQSRARHYPIAPVGSQVVSTFEHRAHPAAPLAPGDPGSPRGPVSGLDAMGIFSPMVDSAPNPNDITNELMDAHTIEMHYPQNPYGYRLHAEILIKVMDRPDLLRAYGRPLDSLLPEARTALLLASRATRSQTGEYILKEDERTLDELYAKRYGGSGIMPVERPRES